MTPHPNSPGADSTGAHGKVRVGVIGCGKISDQYFNGMNRYAVLEVVAQYPNLKELVWAQEEPRNMGAWDFAEPRLREVLPAKLHPRYMGRKAASSPAVGSHHAHDLEQQALVNEVLA